MSTEQKRRPLWLMLAQILWVLITLFTLAAFIKAGPIFYNNRNQLCTLPADLCSPNWLITPDLLEQLQTIHMTIEGWAAYTLGTRVISTLVFLVLGGFIFIRKRDDPMALLVSFLFITFGTSNGVTGELARVGSAWENIIYFLSTLGWVCFILFFSLFPNGKFVPRFIRWVTIAFITVMVLGFVFPETADRIQQRAGWIPSVYFLGLFVTMLVAQIYRYRWVSTPIERRQTRWVVFGIVILSVCIIVPASFSIGQPTMVSSPLLALYASGFANIIFLLLPLSIGVAILRSNLFDIDLIIRKTLLYGTLTALMGLVYFGAVIFLQELFGRISEQANSPLAIVISTLAIAALFNPLRGRLQAFIDRRFFRQKYNADQALEAFARAARDEVEIERLTNGLAGTVRETMQPEVIMLWLKQTPPAGFKRNQ